MNIILKCDDFWGKDWKKEKIFLDLVVANNVKISLGIVGFGFTNASQEAVDYLKEYADNIEPFNHSFWHVVSDPVKEFYKTNGTYQFTSINSTNDIILKRLGITAETIGFPANACDESTIDILKGDYFNSIKNIYYTKDAHNQAEIEKIGKRIINIDGGSVMQLHPFTDDFDLAKFEYFLNAELEKGNNFIFPSEL